MVAESVEAHQPAVPEPAEGQQTPSKPDIPSEFSRTIIDLIENQKGKLIGIFAFVFIFVYVLSIFGLGMFGFVGIVLALIYAVLS